MGGGGGAPSHTTTTTQIDPTVKQWEQQNYNYAQNIANTPYSPYTGQMVAPLNSLETAGITQGSQLAQSNLGMGAINQGITNANQAGNYSPLQVQAPQSVAQVSAPGAYNPMQVNTGTWNSAAAQQYMSPYTQSVIDAANQNIDRSLAQTQAATNAQAVTAGAYGGTRQAVANAENARNADQLKAQTAAGLLSDAYNNAQSAFQADQGRSLAAQQANQQAGLSAGLTAQQQALQASLANQQASLANQQMGLTAQQANQQAGLNAANLGLGSADLLGRLGVAQQGIGQGNAQALLNYGSVLQNQQQNENQWAYQNTYLNPQQWPLRGLSAMESAVSGIPYGTTSGMTVPNYSNPVGGALGGAAAGAGLASALTSAGAMNSWNPWGWGMMGAGALLGYMSNS